MTPEIQKELETLKIELDAAQARYNLASHFAGMDKPTPENFPDGWETEWQPSFETATIGTKPAPKFKKDEPIAPPRLTADDLQFLEFEASEIVQRKPETPENIARVAEIDAILAGDEAQELRLKQAFDEAALAYYSFGVELALKQKLAASAVFDKPFDEAELNRKAKEAYFMMIDLDEKREEFFDAFGKYYQVIFLQRYKYAPPVFNITTFNNNNGVIEWRK